MKGEIFNLLEDFVVEKWGRDKFEEIFAATHSQLQTKGPFVGPGTYPDSDFMLLVSRSVESFGVDLPVAIKAFGHYCFPRLAQKVAKQMNEYSHAKDFLKDLHRIIHVEVRKIYRDAETPHFTFQDPAPNKLIMIYHSKRKLYDFVEGLLDGVSDYFKIPISYTRRPFVENGKELCEFAVTFG